VGYSAVGHRDLMIGDSRDHAIDLQRSAEAEGEMCRRMTTAISEIVRSGPVQISEQSHRRW